MDDRQELIRLDAMSKSYASKSTRIEILDRASFSVFKGETIALVGASGIGKSTVLNLIGTLDRPDSGRIWFKSNDLSSWSGNKLAGFRNTHIGFVFQFHYLLHGFSAIENVMMPGLIAGKNKKSIEKNAINMLERVGLLSRKQHRVEDLSGGEQQRVALARALVLKPEILLADEPTGNLDQKNSQSVHTLMKELNQELGMTIIVVTHNNELARTMGRTVTLSKGQIVSVKY